MSRERVVSLFDVDDVTEFGPVRDYVVTRLPPSDLNEFCRRWHYADHADGSFWTYGIWDGMTLVGGVGYNTPTVPAAGAVFGSDKVDWVAHMSRLVCADDAPRNTESRLIGASLRLLKSDRPQVRGVLTYAAAGQGHIGYVYQATNAIYCGVTAPDRYYVTQSGERRSPRTFTDTRDPSWTRVMEPGKHRYVYLLGNKTERREARALLRFPVLPYPKVVTA